MPSRRVRTHYNNIALVRITATAYYDDYDDEDYYYYDDDGNNNDNSRNTFRERARPDGRKPIGHRTSDESQGWNYSVNTTTISPPAIIIIIHYYYYYY